MPSADDRVILALDQGTTSSRAIAFDREGRQRSVAQREIEQHFPRPGWVEHDADEIWETSYLVAGRALAEAGGDAVAIGITNQRETTILWDRQTGRPIHRAVVWQDRRTADACAAVRAVGHGPLIRERTGLVIDPYFSATKIAWLLDHVPGARERAERGELAFGTVDSWLLWKLTGGRVHATDATNASRTLLYDIRRNQWDDELLALFGVPAGLLPEVRDCAAELGTTDPALFGRPIPIRGMAGDQQAATIGQACFRPGEIKSTYGTGCFAVLNTGATPVASGHDLLTTIAYRLGGATTYALEGAIFVSGASVQWLRDGLGLIRTAAETEALAQSLASNDGVYLVPAFTGLGAPWWDAEARALIMGLTRDTGPAHLARAALEAVAYQTLDLIEAMTKDAGAPTELRVDGGMVANDWLMQFLADMLGLPVDRPRVAETTALGAAYLAGLQSGLFHDLDDVRSRWSRERRFEPAMDAERRTELVAGWRDAVRRTLTHT